MEYQDGKIYKITGNGMTYFGSTINSLDVRFSQHVCEKYKYDNKKCTSKLIIDTEKAIIELVENFPCNSRKELEQRERYWIENNECVNKSIPCRTHEEYLQYLKEYYVENRDTKLEYMKKYYEEKSSELIIKMKQYHEKNRDEILKNNNTKVTCECGCIVNNSGLLRHKYSKKHQKQMAKRQNHE